MPDRLRALVLDDEPLSQDFLRELLSETFPNIDVETRSVPDASGNFDVYFLDNDFNGEAKAGELAREIRRDHPDELVIAFSGTLDQATLKELVNAGCNGVCDKTVPTDLPTAMRILRNYVESLSVPGAEAAVESPTGILGAIRSISELLREWNQRLEVQEQGLQDAQDAE